MSRAVNNIKKLTKRVTTKNVNFQIAVYNYELSNCSCTSFRSGKHTIPTEHTLLQKSIHRDLFHFKNWKLLARFPVFAVRQ